MPDDLAGRLDPRPPLLEMIDRSAALSLVTAVPRTTAELYRTYADLPADVRLSVSHRRARKRLGRTLEQLAREGTITREITTGDPHNIIQFRTLASPASDSHTRPHEAYVDDCW